MSKELEALNEIINKFVEILLAANHEKPTAVSISSLNNTLRLALHDKLDIIEKELKALEIIKEVLPIEIKIDIVENSYYLFVINRGFEITQEEYELLKEVLL